MTGRFHVLGTPISTWAGAIILVGAVALAIMAPWIYPGDPLDIDNPTFRPPSREYPMGTDHIGRDVLVMMVWGTRISMLFAFGAAGLSLVVGVLFGGLSGYFGGWLDDLLSRSFEVFIVIPRLFLIILVVAMFGTHLWLAVLVVGLTIWPSNARIMRAQVLSLKNREYVQAATVSGAGHLQVLFEHIVPNGIGPVLANSTLQMAYAVLTEAGLSFLGLGDPNTPSWGRILYAGQNYITSAPWLVIFPGVAIAALLVGLHLLGTSALHLLNPRMQQFPG
jgi:peptide/nickel transport system permease protein